jgi:hypothetical protein
MPTAPRRNFSTRASAETPKQSEADAATKERDEREYTVETANVAKVVRDSFAYLVPEYVINKKIDSKNIISFAIADSLYTMLLDSYVNKKIDTTAVLRLEYWAGGWEDIKRRRDRVGVRYGSG